MARSRSPNRDKAFEIWRASNGKVKLIDIADQLGVSDSQIRKWKNQDKWNEQLKVTLPKENSNVTKKRGAPKGNKNAKGNSGGAAPKGNQNAVKHGFFRKIFPDDEETFEILEEIQIKSPIDILWENIQIQYLAIARAQKIMFVRDQDDITQVLKRSKSFSSEKGDSSEEEFEIQMPWDKHATFLQAQSRAIAALLKLIEQYESMANDEQKLRVEKLKAEIEKTKAEIKEDGHSNERVIIVNDKEAMRRAMENGD